MARKSSDRKSQFLGEPLGTASHKLRKALLFKYVQLAGDDTCFKCGNRIERVDDLSIEHKQPWEGRDPALFYDLNNIAFSHLKCNRPHAYRNGSPIHDDGPPGTSWCSLHNNRQGAYVSTEDFGLLQKTGRKSRLNHSCRSCLAEETRRWRESTDSSEGNI